MRTTLCSSLNRFAATLLIVSAVLIPNRITQAQPNNNNNNNNNNNSNSGAVNPFFFQQPVGGVSIDAGGLLNKAKADPGQLKELRAQMARNIPAPLNKPVPLRSISLRRLIEAIDETVRNHRPISEDLALLGGLQQIRYVFVYPEQKDIVLVGPAEGWKIDAHGNLVGVTTGQSVMYLDDFVVALRTASRAAASGITCSIDPTADGLKQLRTFVAGLQVIGDREQTATGIEQALGEQSISVSGVPATSHFARVLVAADYRMKRLAMKFDPSPITGLPSFLDMLSGSGHGMSNMMQRWWLEPKYDSILKAADGLAWEFAGGSVKCMTEDDYVASTGDRQHSGKPSPLAQKWADNMTRRYKVLAVADPIFGQLRNCMELAMVGALIARENLATKAGCDITALTDDSMLKPVVLPRATHVDSKVSMLKKGQNWVISASGGVMIRPWEIVSKARPDEAPAAAREKNTPSKSSDWFWN